MRRTDVSSIDTLSAAKWLYRTRVEESVLASLENAGWSVRSSTEIAPGERAAECDDCGQVIIAQRLRDAFARLNPALRAEALGDTLRKLTRPAVRWLCGGPFSQIPDRRRLMRTHTLSLVPSDLLTSNVVRRALR